MLPRLKLNLYLHLTFVSQDLSPESVSSVEKRLEQRWSFNATSPRTARSLHAASVAKLSMPFHYWRDT